MSKPASPLRILLIEDSEDDALLILRELRRNGYDPEWERVETPEALHSALAHGTWDAVTCDFVMPRFSAIAALEIIEAHRRERDDVLPVIIVSGEVDEEAAVSAMKAGANYFVSKRKLVRLVPALQREIEEAQEQRSRRELERALRDSEERLRLAVDSADLGMWDWDVKKRRVHFSGSWKRRLGYGEDALLGDFEGWARLVHPDDVQPLINELQAYLFLSVRTPQPPWQFEYRLRHRDGSYRWILAHGSVLRDDNGVPQRMLGCDLDVTQRKEAETALRASEANLQSILNNSLQSFLLVDREGRIRAFNQIASVRAQLLFLSAPLRQGEPVCEHLPEPERSLVSQDLDRALAGESVVVERRLRGAAGMDYWFEFSFVPIRQPDDAVTGVCLGIVDVTERQRADAERARLSAAVEQAAESIAITDTEGVIIYVNPAFERSTGYSRSEVCGRSARALSDDGDRATERSMRELLDREGFWRGTELRRHKDGSLHEVDLVVSRVSDAGGQVINYVRVARPRLGLRRLADLEGPKSGTADERG